ncbi:MAG: glycosyltransferase family 2 protein [Bifidobacteriaceae bacterium]|jgi:glycosyltransferase involved in cell wall biosynthesis|nr:glycosyltransferase family 2 protein [Bifidobacteriaceae bacterium]
MNTTADVSVVITCFNQGATIAHAVASACRQTVTPRCITVVDDGSKDLVTSSVLEDLLDENSAVSTTRTGIPLRIIEQDNAGVSAARNAGIDAAHGSVIAVLDGDDAWEPEFLEYASAALETPDETSGTPPVAVSSWLQTFGVLDTVVRPTGGELTAFLSHNCCPASCVFRKASWQAAGGYDETMRSGFEDWDFSLRLLESAAGTARIDIVAEPLIRYRTAPISPNITSMNHRLDLMRLLIDHHSASYRENIAEAVTGVEAISMARLAELESALAQIPQGTFAEATFGDGGMAAAVRLASRRAS